MHTMQMIKNYQNEKDYSISNLIYTFIVYKDCVILTNL